MSKLFTCKILAIYYKGNMLKFKLTDVTLLLNSDRLTLFHPRLTYQCAIKSLKQACNFTRKHSTK